jgi:hypothetical protein
MGLLCLQQDVMNCCLHTTDRPVWNSIRLSSLVGDFGSKWTPHEIEKYRLAGALSEGMRVAVVMHPICLL